MKNRQFQLAARPVGLPKESDFVLVETPMPEAGAGEVLLRTLYLSIDPYMRKRMDDVKSYAPSVKIGQVMVGGGICQVVESHHPDYSNGDIVSAPVGWQEYAVSDGKGLRKIDPALAPVSTGVGVLGMPGLTAYFGLLELGQPKAGETVVVSGAAGAVGSLVGQIAKIMGCRVVGIAGTDAKVDYLIDELGFDAAYNYRQVSNHARKLSELCPEGVDVYFDNVGGEITDGVFRVLNTFARVAVCGQISGYNETAPQMGPRLFDIILTRQVRVEGFIVSRFNDRAAEGLRQLAEWLREDRIHYREDVVNGLESAPGALIGILQGQNNGKMLVKVSEV